MAKKDGTRDLFMQFFDMVGTYNAADSTTLMEFQKPTGISIRGQLLFLIHLIEVDFSFEGQSHVQMAALSTRAGLAAMPEVGDDGLVARMAQETIVTTNGGLRSFKPYALHYLPPVPLAAPQLSLYLATVVNVAALQGDAVHARLGFTTAPLDAAAYTEIAEVWGW